MQVVETSAGPIFVFILCFSLLLIKNILGALMDMDCCETQFCRQIVMFLDCMRNENELRLKPSDKRDIMQGYIVSEGEELVQQIVWGNHTLVWPAEGTSVHAFKANDL